MFMRTTRFRLPTVIKYLLIINVAVFLLDMILQTAGVWVRVPGGSIPVIIFGMGGEQYGVAFSLIPLSFAETFGINLKFQIHQLITYMFFHADFMHLLLNMFMLWMFGTQLELAMGSKKFLFYYLIAGIGAGLISILVPTMGMIIGASGAIFALLVAVAYLWPNQIVLLFFIIPVRIKYLVIGYIVLEFLLSLSSFSGVGQSVVAHITHFGGGLIGFLAIAIMYPKIRFAYQVQSVFLKIGDYFSELFHRIKQKAKDAPKKKDYKVKHLKTGSPEDEDTKIYYTDKFKNKGKDSSAQDKVEEYFHNRESIMQIFKKASEKGIDSLTEKEKEILKRFGKKPDSDS